MLCACCAFITRRAKRMRNTRTASFKKHYSVMFENDAVRVLRIHYAPGEKSVMHSHPNSVIVFLEDQKAKMTHPDGKSEEVSGKKGDAVFSPAGAHLPENIGSGPIDVILVELKKIG